MTTHPELRKDRQARVSEAVIDATPLWRPVAAITLVAIALVCFFTFGLADYTRLEALREYDTLLRSWAHAKGPVAVASFMGVFILVALACIPAIAFLGVASGYLFGPVAGPLFAYTAAIGAAVLSYVGARYAFRDAALRRGGKMLMRMETALKRNALPVMVFMRLLPILPYWTANVVPAVLGVRFRLFLLASAVGLLPGSLLLPNLGHGIAEAVAVGGDPSVAVLSNPRIVIPVSVAAVLSISVVIWRVVRHVRLRKPTRRQVTSG